MAGNNGGNKRPAPVQQRQPVTPVQDKVVSATPPEQSSEPPVVEETPQDTTGVSSESSDQTNESTTPTEGGDEQALNTADSTADATVVTSDTPEETPVNVEPVVETATEDDSELVASLKDQLAAFVTANGNYGQKPEDFKQSAKLAAQITRFVIKYPKTDVLNALLAFFRENKDGACKGENFMKGSTTLTQTEEQKVGFLYNMFSGIANNLKIKVESAAILRTLEKPEFVTFYQRRMAALSRTN